MKILIIRLSSLGDIVLTEPIARRLREVFPDAELDYITKPQFCELVQMFGTVKHVIPYSKTYYAHREIWRAHYDLFYDLHAKFSSYLLKYFAFSATIFTYDKQHNLRRQIVRHKTSEEIKSTLVLYQSALKKAAQKLAIPALAEPLPYPKLEVEPKAVEQLKEKWVKSAEKKVVALFPGAAYFTKMYPLPQWEQFVQAGSNKYYFLLLGSASEKALAEQIYKCNPEACTNLCGQFNWRELINVIATSDAVVSNDSGPMHLAAALNKPQIAIFGATHPKLGFAPLNNKAFILCKNLSCQPCSLHGGDKCPQQHFNCMRNLTPEEILTALDKFFN